MKNITRLALAFAVAAIACLSPMAHADEAQLVPPGSQRHYVYHDKDGYGKMVVTDGSTNGYPKPIYVTIYQNGHVFYGEGTRSQATQQSNWYQYCEFWVYGSGISAKFKGYMPETYTYLVGWGEYFLNGSGSPYEWTCQLDVD